MRSAITMCLCVLFLPGLAWAGVMNGGFEDNFNNWARSGNTKIITSATLDSITIDPFGGDKMAAITYPATEGSLYDNGFSQDVVLSKDDNWFSFHYNFWTYDEAPFDQPGFTVSVNGETKLSVDAGDVGDTTLANLDYTGWKLFNIDVSEYFSDSSRPATIRLAFNAGNTGDNQHPSGVFIDQAVLTPNQVPVPGALWLLGSGLLCLFGFQRKTSNSNC